MTMKFGFIGLERTGSDVPAIVAAMLNLKRHGVRALLVSTRARVCNVFGFKARDQRERETALISSLTSGEQQQWALELLDKVF